MRKRVFGRKLSRERDSRRALFRALMRSLVEHGKIKTTKAKAKAIQADIDKIINLAKKGTVVSKRRVFAKLGNDKLTAKKIVEVIAPKFMDRSGGFTKRISLPRRKGDYAEIVRLEWVEEIVKPEDKKIKKENTKSKKKPETKKK